MFLDKCFGKRESWFENLVLIIESEVGLYNQSYLFAKRFDEQTHCFGLTNGLREQTHYFSRTTVIVSNDTTVGQMIVHFEET